MKSRSRNEKRNYAKFILIISFLLLVCKKKLKICQNDFWDNPDILSIESVKRIAKVLLMLLFFQDDKYCKAVW